jgi:uncharacterized protein YlxW (UPF0749 family)
VFENIKTLRPHFHSLREVQENVSLDIKLPLTWKYDEVVKPYSSISIKVQDKNEKFNLISLVTQSTQNGYDVVFACANEIVNKNKEEEEKQRLFQQKVKELQQLFQNESLDKLKDINLMSNYGQEITTSEGVVGQGDGEGQDGDTESEESDD